MIKTDDFQKTVELIDKSSDVLITTHIWPDGDACGSVAAMYEVLVALGKKAEVIHDLLTDSQKEIEKERPKRKPIKEYVYLDRFK